MGKWGIAVQWEITVSDVQGEKVLEICSTHSVLIVNTSLLSTSKFVDHKNERKRIKDRTKWKIILILNKISVNLLTHEKHKMYY